MCLDGGARARDSIGFCVERRAGGHGHGIYGYGGGGGIVSGVIVILLDRILLVTVDIMYKNM